MSCQLNAAMSISCDQACYRGASPIGKRAPSEDPPRTLGMDLRYCPRRVRFLKVKYPCRRQQREAAQSAAGHAPTQNPEPYTLNPEP